MAAASGSALPDATPAGASSGGVVSGERLNCLFWANVESLSNAEQSAGLPEAEYLRRCALVLKLEYFMNSLENAEHLADFPNLVELAVHLEKVPKILGLHNKQSLLRLCMTEVGLKRMVGCEACVQLTHLDLSHNKLTEMEPAVLGRLTKLNTLWLNDNAIERIQGLEACLSLSTLWLCSNRIVSVMDSLSGNVNLEELNLAGNQLSNFKDIPNLARMRRLSTLSFAEPHFGDNPLCALCNYQTYVLFHMQHLRVLDTMVITDDLRQLAEAVRRRRQPPPPAAASRRQPRPVTASDRQSRLDDASRLLCAVELPSPCLTPSACASRVCADVHEEEDVLQHAYQDAQAQHLQRNPQGDGGTSDQGEPN